MTQNVLVVAAHPDDEVLGCGGTIARHAQQGDRVTCLILGEGLTSRYVTRAAGLAAADLSDLRDASRRAADILGVARLETAEFPDNRFDSVSLLDVVKRIEAVYSVVQPALVCTHHPGDVNIDHLVTHRAVLAACRQVPTTSIRGLYFFEVPSSTEWQTPALGCPFTPNHFVDISHQLPAKLSALMAYSGEARAWPHPRSPDATRALAQWRGATAGVDAAEAFVVGRQVVTQP